MKQSAQLSGANALRFYAASSIVLFHLIHLTKIDYPPALSFIPNFGGLGVPLFYVLSAFVLCIGYHSRLGTSHEIRKFYTRRFFRIAPLFYILIFIYIIIYWQFYDNPISIERVLSSITFTFNLIPGHSTGFVWASWSIGVEMIFYAIFPIVLMYATSFFKALLLFIFSVFLAHSWSISFIDANGDLAKFGTYSLVGYMVYFAAGIVSYYVWTSTRRTDLVHKITTSAAIAVIILLIGKSSVLRQFIAENFGSEYVSVSNKSIWAVVLAVLVVGMGFETFQSRFLSVTATLGEASYSIYLLHPILIVGLNTLGVYQFLYGILPGEFSSFVASVIVTFAVLLPISLLSYHWIEKGLGIAARELVKERSSGSRYDGSQPSSR